MSSFIKKNRFIRFIFFPVIHLRRKKAKAVHDGLNTLFDRFIEKVKAGEITLQADHFKGTFTMGIQTGIVKRYLLYGEYEQKLTELVIDHVDKNRDVIDVGANIGLFTVLSAKLVSHNRKVLAIEPTENALYYLRKNISQNECGEKVLIFSGVAADNPGTFTINSVVGKEEYSSLGKLDHEDAAGLTSVQVEVLGETIDSLVKKDGLEPGFIKIDTEGAEYSVLSGAMQTIKKHRPVILSEVSDRLLKSQNSSSAALFHLLRTLNYTIYEAYTLAEVNRDVFDGDIIAFPNNQES